MPQTDHRLKIILTHMMVLLGDVGEVEALFTIVLISMQDRCTICVERAIVSEVILGAPEGTPR